MLRCIKVLGKQRLHGSLETDEQTGHPSIVLAPWSVLLGLAGLSSFTPSQRAVVATGAMKTGFVTSPCFNLTRYFILSQAMSMLVLISSFWLKPSEALSPMNALGYMPVALITT